MSTLPTKKISTAKAAKILGVSRWTLRRWGDKKEIAFTSSKSGYRYYKEEDLIAFKEKHAIVHIVAKKRGIKKGAESSQKASSDRDETLLLPSPPKPVGEAVLQPYVHVGTEKYAAKPEALIVPPPPPPPPHKKKSMLSHLWKILPFTGAAVFLIVVLFPVVTNHTTVQQPLSETPFSGEQPSPILPLLSFRDVVLAAATDSSGLNPSSVQFFLSDSHEPIDHMLSPDRNIPDSGNTIYLSNMTSFANFQESPFAYLNGSHGPAGPVAIIDNEETLRNHPFFANVHNGDKLLIYKESGKAILFRPYTNEVIAFAPLNAIPSSSYEQIDGQPVVALRNGMGTPYDMKPFEAELTYVSPTSVVVDNANASRGDYKKSLIVDVVGNKKAEAQELSYKLRLTLSDLPDGEFRPPAGVDFLVILGRDRVSSMNYIAPTSTASATPKTP